MAGHGKSHAKGKPPDDRADVRKGQSTARPCRAKGEPRGRLLPAQPTRHVVHEVKRVVQPPPPLPDLVRLVVPVGSWCRLGGFCVPLAPGPCTPP